MMEKCLPPDLQLAERTKSIRQRVAEAADKSGRTGQDVSVMAVTKTVPAQRINQAIACGFTLLGENRVQEYLEKYPDYHSDGCSIHFIGSLQSNKVKYIVDKVDMIESVNNLKLAQEIEKRAAVLGKRMDILLEVNIGEEESKSGVLPQHLFDLVAQIEAFPHLCVSGLMAIPPIYSSGEKSAYYFGKMNQLFLDMKAKKIHNGNVRFLSMGMSNDFETAIQCGANIVRLGTILFGKR